MRAAAGRLNPVGERTGILIGICRTHAARRQAQRDDAATCSGR
jgi:hypothetical protein